MVLVSKTNAELVADLVTVAFREGLGDMEAAVDTFDIMRDFADPVLARMVVLGTGEHSTATNERHSGCDFATNVVRTA